MSDKNNNKLLIGVASSLLASLGLYAIYNQFFAKENDTDKDEEENKKEENNKEKIVDLDKKTTDTNTSTQVSQDFTPIDIVKFEECFEDICNNLVTDLSIAVNHIRYSYDPYSEQYIGNDNMLMGSTIKDFKTEIIKSSQNTNMKYIQKYNFEPKNYNESLRYYLKSNL